MNPPSFNDGNWSAMKQYLQQMAQAISTIEGGPNRTADFRGASILGLRALANTTVTDGETKALWLRLGFLTAADGIGSVALVADETVNGIYLGKAVSGTLITDALWTVYRVSFINNPVNQLEEFKVESATDNPTAVWADRLSLPF